MATAKEQGFKKIARPIMPIDFEGQSTDKKWLQKVAEGLVEGYSYDRKFGYNPALASGVIGDIYEWGKTALAQRYTFSDDGVADIDRLSSDDALDAGIEITIIGLDINGTEVTQTIALDDTDATTPVALTTSLWRVNRVYNSNGTDLVGNIYVFVDGDTTAGVPDDVTFVRGYVSIGNGQTLQSVYTVPAGKTAYFYSSKLSIIKKTAGFAYIYGKVRLFGKVFRTVDLFGITSAGTSRTNDDMAIPLQFPEKTDLVISADSDSAMGISASFFVLLKDN